MPACVSVQPLEADLQVCVEGSKSWGFYFTPALLKECHPSIPPSMHSFIYSFIRLCATPWAWCWRHWLLGTDDKVLLAEGSVQGRKTIKKETQKGRYIFANPDNPDQSHPHCYRGRRLRPREGQRQLGVTQQVNKAPCWAPGWTF